MTAEKTRWLPDATSRTSRRREMLDQQGLSMVELLVSLLLLAVVTLSILSMVTVSVHLNQLAKERTIATSLASERIQQIAARPYQAAADYLTYKLSEETASAGPPRTFTADYGSIPQYPGFKRVVELYYDVPYAGTLAVETRVSWTHVSKGEKTHEMITYFHPRLE